jgi:hypothetical protein
MQAREWVICEAMIKFHILTPGVHAVAIATCSSQLALMGILGLMAAHTIHSDFCAHVIAMAIAAFGFRMGTEKCELGLLVMIELRIFPGFNTVAILALRSKLAAMYILNSVAIITSGGQAFVDFSNVTANAGCFGVAAL